MIIVRTLLTAQAQCGGLTQQAQDNEFVESRLKN